MLIVADENLPCVAEAFGKLGEVRLVPGRRMSPAEVREAELLCVRAVTRVNAALLEGSRVRWVGTATIGTDHVDLDYLKERGIAFADAQGCNANAVSEWVLASLFYLAGRKGAKLEGMTIGVVGVGNVGRRVVGKCAALGLRVLANDPPRARVEGPEGFVDLETLLPEADVVTLHVPLNRKGADRTLGLFDAARLATLKPGAWLFNSSRGGIVDEVALKAALRSGQVGAAAIDTWSNEPEIDVELAELAEVATPHVAGHSAEGKLGGTQMIFAAATRFLGSSVSWDMHGYLPPGPPGVIALAIGSDGWPAAVQRLVDAAYPLERDVRAFKGILALPAQERGAFFDAERRKYGVRREFGATRFHLCAAPEYRARIRALGFEPAPVGA